MATPKPIQLISRPGIKRDSTTFEGDLYIDGEWCRFNARALPTKIGGFSAVTQHLPEIVRGIDSFTVDATNYVHCGSRGLLTQVQTDLAGSAGTIADRTPVGLVGSDTNLWQLTAFYDKVSGNTSLVAHAGQNLADIASSVETTIYYGPVSTTAQLVATGMDQVSGGVMAVPPYLVAFGNDGRVDVSALNDLTQPNQSAFVTAQKIIAGLPVRSSGGPAGLLWSLDSLVAMTFDGNIQTGIPFDFNIIDDQTSILSSRGVVQFDSIYYWVGADRFLLYNGVVKELPNNLNIDFFFSNLNFAQRQKVFAFKVPRWGEIWWCFPMGSATECNHAVIYNVRLNTWYDTPLPDSGRSSAVFAKVFQRPFITDVDASESGYTLWQHEIGVDKVAGSTILPVRASFTTHELSPLVEQQPIDKAFRVDITEPDFNQTGDLTMTVLGRQNARGAQQELAAVTVPQDATSPDNQIAEVKVEARLLAFKFETNEPGGDFSLGRTMVHIEPTTGRYTQ
jgi:hypothetical protein